MTSEPEKLLPCPFCGDTDIRRGAERDVDGNPDSWFVTTCDTCGAELNGRTQGIADERWNRRLSSPVSGTDMVMVSREQLARWSMQAIGMFCALHNDQIDGEPVPSFMAEMETMLAASPSTPIPVIAEAGEREEGEFDTVEPWEHDDQRELSLLFNHRFDDSLQFNRGQMRTAIRHGRRLSTPATLDNTAVEGQSAIKAIQAEIDKPLQGPTHGAWDRGRIDGLQEAIKIIRATSAYVAVSSLPFDCADCNAGEPEQCMKASYCQHRDGPTCEVLDEDWLSDVISDSLDLDWTPRDGARAIIRAFSNFGVKQDDAGTDNVAGPAVVGADQQTDKMVGEKTGKQEKPLADLQHLLPEAARMLRLNGAEYHAGQIEAIAEALAKMSRNLNTELSEKLRSVISHATGGSFRDENAPLNTICCEITRVRNYIYEAGRLGSAGAEWEALERAVDDDLLLIEMLSLGDFPTRDFADRLAGAARRLRAALSPALDNTAATEPWWTDAGSVAEARRAFQEGRRALLQQKSINTHLRGVYEPIIAALEPMLSTLAVLDTGKAAALDNTAATHREAIRREIINTPETADFMAGVPLEAVHQRERWGVDHGAGKGPLDWFWLIGYLAQQAADAAMRGDEEKAKHHTISTAAALANWHAALTGADTSMRPGIEPPATLTAKTEKAE